MSYFATAMHLFALCVVWRTYRANQAFLKQALEILKQSEEIDALAESKLKAAERMESDYKLWRRGGTGYADHSK